MQEQAFLNARTERTSKAIERFLGLSAPLSDPSLAPRLAFAFSGGGYRAFSSAMGFMDSAVGPNIPLNILIIRFTCPLLHPWPR